LRAASKNKLLAQTLFVVLTQKAPQIKWVGRDRIPNQTVSSQLQTNPETRFRLQALADLLAADEGRVFNLLLAFSGQQVFGRDRQADFDHGFRSQFAEAWGLGVATGMGVEGKRSQALAADVFSAVKVVFHFFLQTAPDVITPLITVSREDPGSQV
jgi:hypothetical protein